MSGDPLDRNDLYLLMESYKNSVEMNTIIMQQLKQIIDAQKEMVKAQAEVSSTQSKSFGCLEDISNTLTNCVDNMQESQKHLINKLDDVNTSIHEHALESVKEHSSIKNKIYIAWGGSAAIIISLLGILSQIWPGGAP